MKPRSVFLVLAAVVVILLSVAGGGLYWIFAQSPLNLLAGGVKTTPTAAIFVPRQAPVMVSMLVNPDRLEAFQQFATPVGDRRRSRREFEKVKQSLLANRSLDYQKDIQPWLGEEITLAVTSLDWDRKAANGIQPGYLLALSTKDTELAREFLQLSFSQQAIAGTTDLVFETYKGVKLIYQRSLKPELESNNFASAVVGNFVLLANHPRVLREAINNVQVGDLNLQNSPAYGEALQTIRDSRIGVAYVNIPALSAWIAKSPVPESPEVHQMLTLALSLKSQGLVAQTALIGVAGEENQPPALAQPVGAFAYVPHDSMVTAAGTDLQQFWQQIEMGLERSSPLQQLLNQAISRIEKPLGLNLPEDIFSWVQGEYALSLVPHPEGKEPDWVFVAEKTPGVNVDEFLEYLDNLAKKQGLSVGNFSVLDTTATVWTKLSTATKASLVSFDAQVQGSHTSVGKYEIFATSIEAMSKALIGSENSLGATEKFAKAIAALPTENDGYFYIDWRQSEPIIEEKLPIIRVFELALQPLFDNLRTLTLSSQGSENGIRRATVYFNLGVR